MVCAGSLCETPHARSITLGNNDGSLSAANGATRGEAELFQLEGFRDWGNSLRAPAVSAHASGARAALVFECARENGDVVSARKGAVWRTMELTGRSAHAGADTARGRSAVSALAHEILRIEGLTEGRPDMTSVSVGPVDNTI